jgi:hypothetical protein
MPISAMMVGVRAWPLRIVLSGKQGGERFFLCREGKEEMDLLRSQSGELGGVGN